MRLFGVLFAVTLLIFSHPQKSWAQGIIRDAEIEAVIRDWSDPIFKAAGLRAEDINIHIINDGSMNAFVTRGQNMFLHTGIILNAETPNELIGVIAHETGHMAGGHLARSDDAMSKAMRPMILTMGLGILAAIAGAPDAGAAIMSSAQKNGTVTFFAYTRVLEASTDQAAENFLEATGQSGKGLLDFFQRFRYNEVFSGATKYPYFLSHPLSSQRINALQARVEASPYKDVVDSPEDQHKLDMIKAKIIGFLKPPETTFNLYPESDTSEPARYARAIAHHQAASTKIALKEMGDLLKEEPDNPYFNEFYGQILFESAQAQKALPYHQRAVDLRPDSPLLRLNLAQALIATDTPENVNKAVKELKKVLAREPDNGFAWYELSIAYERQDKTALAKLATAEQAYAMGDYMRARSFAQRALMELPQGTPDWRRANDITLVIAADPRIRKQMAQRRKRR
ncbi:MAG: M48 family metalloprotease [Robiginitomaculum sp.]|nr:M48 family metalloprotease [Robiginitomaculum sp.]MDQ7078942.1 M48 family metalloprotease [Robiginitomaculum sp.]